MNEKKSVAIPFYRHRYIIGYAIIGILLLVSFAFFSLYTPSGLRSEEMTSAVSSHMLSIKEFTPSSIINAPYHVLQKASFYLLGISSLSIKLPSLMVGIIAIGTLFILLKEWFRKRIAIITGIMTITLPAVLFAVQDGTPTIFFIASFLWLMTSALYLTRKRGNRIFWYLCLVISASLLLYSPLGIYILLVMAGVAAFHPHVRYTIRKIPLAHCIATISGVLVISTPLIYAAFKDPSLVRTMLGIPSGAFSIIDNAKEVAMTLFNFTSVHTGVILQPVVPLGVLLLALVGAYGFIVDYYTARSQMLLASAVTLIILVLIQPQYVLYCLPILAVLIAKGMSIIIHEWYRLFPYNPYARVFGLLPILAIVVVISATDLARYITSYTYHPDITNSYSNDIDIIRDRLRSEKASSTIVAPAQLVPFYSLLGEYGPTKSRVKVESAYPATTGDTIYMTHESYYASKPTRPVREIITSHLTNQSDRFYLYKNTDK